MPQFGATKKGYKSTIITVMLLTFEQTCFRNITILFFNKYMFLWKKSIVIFVKIGNSRQSVRVGSYTVIKDDKARSLCGYTDDLT